MAFILFQPQDNGNLKQLAQSEQSDPALAVDEYRDENSRSQVLEFIVLCTEDGEFGTFHTVEVEDDAPVQPKRKIKVAGANAAQAESSAKRTVRKSPAKSGLTEKAAAPKRTTTKKTTTKKTAAKPASSAKGGKKLSKSGGSAIKRNKASDE